MTDPDFGTDRLATARLMHGEALRLRALQDERADDLRQRSVMILTVVASATALVVGLSADSKIAAPWLRLAAVAVIVMAGAAFAVHMPFKGFLDGPNIEDLATIQYAEAHPEHRVLRDVAVYHHRIHASNEKALRPLRRAFRVELIAAGVAVASIIIGAAV